MAKLFIICGHGAGDPGACGNGYQEAERVRTLAKRIKKFGGDSVKVGDTSKNWYKSRLVSKNNIPNGYLVLELHMDSAVKSAKGAHIIIKSGMNADKYDKALADYLAKVFPGRSNKIVKRSDLANINRAAAVGINYRLAECGFITNAGDIKKFNSEMDEIAKGILKCFGIKVSDTPTSSDKTSKKPKEYKVKVTSKTLNVRAGAGTKYKVVDKVKKDDVYTITEEKLNGANRWGKLKSEIGWIHLGYTKKC